MPPTPSRRQRKVTSLAREWVGKTGSTAPERPEAAAALPGSRRPRDTDPCPSHCPGGRSRAPAPQHLDGTALCRQGPQAHPSIHRANLSSPC